jgi:hypothetical protein
LEEAGKEQQQFRGQKGAAAGALKRGELLGAAADTAKTSRRGEREGQRQGAGANFAGGMGTSIQDQLDMGIEQFISKLADGELTLEELASIG